MGAVEEIMDKVVAVLSSVETGMAEEIMGKVLSSVEEAGAMIILVETEEEMEAVLSLVEIVTVDKRG